VTPARLRLGCASGRARAERTDGGWLLAYVGECPGKTWKGRERFSEGDRGRRLGSERDEPGCMRFNVLQDAQDQNVYYFYEAYRDEAALEAHRAAPHYAVWRAAADTLDGPPQRRAARPSFPRGRLLDAK